MNQTHAQYRTPLLVVVAMITVWSLLGVLDARNEPYTGYQTDPEYVVTSVSEGSPADDAGLRVEDRVRTVDGVAIENLRQPRPAIGSTSVLEIERDGSVLTLEIVNGARSTRSVVGSYMVVLIGLCFLFFGYSAYTKAPARKTLLLALAGAGIGFTFAGGPHIGSPALSSLVTAMAVLMLYGGLAMLYHFVLSMPGPSARLARAGTLRLLYAPAVIAGLIIAVVIGTQMNPTGTLDWIIQVVVGIVLVGYCLGSIAAVIRRYGRAAGAQRRAHGLGLMLAGTVLGFGPLLVVILIDVIAPDVVLPGSNYYILTFALIPITFSMAAVRSEYSRQAAMPDTSD